jgi:CRP-like cAMP-binding protein
VTSGQLSVVRPSRDPGLVLQRLGRGDAFGEVGVLNSAPRLASIIAVDETETIEVRKEDLDRVLEDDPRAMRHMLGTCRLSLTLAKEELARHNSRLEHTSASAPPTCARASSSSSAARARGRVARRRHPASTSRG